MKSNEEVPSAITKKNKHWINRQFLLNLRGDHGSMPHRNVCNFVKLYATVNKFRKQLHSVTYYMCETWRGPEKSVHEH